MAAKLPGPLCAPSQASLLATVRGGGRAWSGGEPALAAKRANHTQIRTKSDRRPLVEM